MGDDFPEWNLLWDFPWPGLITRGYILQMARENDARLVDSGVNMLTQMCLKTQVSHQDKVILWQRLWLPSEFGMHECSIIRNIYIYTDTDIGRLLLPYLLYRCVCIYTYDYIYIYVYVCLYISDCYLTWFYIYIYITWYHDMSRQDLSSPRCLVQRKPGGKKNRGPKNTDLQFRDWINWIFPYMNLDIFRYWI